MNNPVNPWFCPQGPWKDTPDFPFHPHKERNSQTETVCEGFGASSEGMWVRSYKFACIRYSKTHPRMEKNYPTFSHIFTLQYRLLGEILESKYTSPKHPVEPQNWWASKPMNAIHGTAIYTYICLIFRVNVSKTYHKRMLWERNLLFQRLIFGCIWSTWIWLKQENISLTHDGSVGLVYLPTHLQQTINHSCR